MRASNSIIFAGGKIDFDLIHSTTYVPPSRMAFPRRSFWKEQNLNNENRARAKELREMGRFRRPTSVRDEDANGEAKKKRRYTYIYTYIHTHIEGASIDSLPLSIFLLPFAAVRSWGRQIAADMMWQAQFAK